MVRPLKNRYTDRLVGIIKHWPEMPLSVFSFIRFLRLSVERKTVLLVEPNAFHGEVLPGFSRYLQDLGYDVVVICRYANVKEDALCRYLDRPEMFVLDPLPMRWVLQMKKITAFDFVFFSSNQIFDPYIRVWGEYIGCLPCAPKARYGAFYVEHSFRPEYQSYLTDPRDMFLLTKTMHNGIEVPMLNPHWFGEVRHTPLSEGKRVFIAVGEVAFKNCSIPLLFETVQQLEKKFEFEVWLVGKGSDSYDPGSLPTSVRTLGRLSFEELFQRMEDADYMLPLLDPESECHKHYLKGVTSGARQLILGFSKVAIIHAEFARRYGFFERDSILYEKDGLLQAMEYALTMTVDEYEHKQRELRMLSDRVYHESLNNLRKGVAKKCAINCTEMQ